MVGLRCLLEWVAGRIGGWRNAGLVEKVASRMDG